MKYYTGLLDDEMKKVEGVETFFSNPNMIGPTTSFTGLALTPWTERPDITDRDVRKEVYSFVEYFEERKAEVRSGRYGVLVIGPCRVQLLFIRGI